MIDYLDADVAYLLGMLVARGELITTGPSYRMIIHFPKGALIAQGERTVFDTDKEIRLGMEKIRERLNELMGADIRTLDAGQNWDLVMSSTRNTIAWRNIGMLLEHRTHFSHFKVPGVIFENSTPTEFKREFVKGYADVAGNIRLANRDQAGRHRVRLDILNYPSNWQVPVQLCLLLQEHLDVPVPVVTWGHPNLGREWREHQLNIYAEEFVRAGFYFPYKQAALDELARVNETNFSRPVRGCPGARAARPPKATHPEEANREKLDERLVNKHFDAYWHICRALDCPRRPQPGEQLEFLLEEQDAIPE